MNLERREGNVSQYYKNNDRESLTGKKSKNILEYKKSIPPRRMAVIDLTGEQKKVLSEKSFPKIGKLFSKSKPVDQNRYYIVEFINLLRTMEFDDAVELVMKHGNQFMFYSKQMERHRKTEGIARDMLLYPPITVTGPQCPNCKGKNTLSIMSRTALGGDEAFTNKCVCLSCAHRWVGR